MPPSSGNSFPQPKANAARPQELIVSVPFDEPFYERPFNDAEHTKLAVWIGGILSGLGRGAG